MPFPIWPPCCDALTCLLFFPTMTTGATWGGKVSQCVNKQGYAWYFVIYGIFQWNSHSPFFLIINKHNRKQLNRQGVDKRHFDKSFGTLACIHHQTILQHEAICFISFLFFVFIGSTEFILWLLFLRCDKLRNLKKWCYDFVSVISTMYN